MLPKIEDTCTDCGERETPWGLARLDFELPKFSRHVWVSEVARATWEKKIIQVARCLAEIEWNSVVSGMRSCSLCWISVGELAEWYKRSVKSGLRTMPLIVQERKPCRPGSLLTRSELKTRLLCRVVVGKKTDVADFKAAWKRASHDEIGYLLGYPKCCRRFFDEMVVRDGITDHVWPTAWRTSTHPQGTHSIEVDAPALMNTLWRSCGLAMLPHLPCSYRCELSVKIAESFAAIGRDAGFGHEMDWAIEILRWPVEWSALHGIAEIKTPILKTSTDTITTPGKYTVRWRGSGYPQEGAQGLRFPYATPVQRRATQPQDQSHYSAFRILN